MNLSLRKVLPFFVLLLSYNICEADSKPVKFKVPSSYVGSTILATDGTTTTTTDITGANVSVSMATKTASLFLVEDGQVQAAIVAPKCVKKTSKCIATSVKTQIKAGANLGKLKSKEDGSLLVGSGRYAKIRKAGAGSLTNASTLASTVASVGRANTGISSLSRRRVAIFAEADNDGLPDALDADDDNDGIIDNFDSSAGTVSEEGNINIFSNFKVAIESTINANTGTTPTTTEIDNLLSSIGTLAIQVAGDEAASETTELDCNGLNYCSTGGSGHILAGGGAGGAFPDSVDSDSDGNGTITKGSTGDFQLLHGAKSTEIAGGDTFVEIVTDSSSNETEVPGILNFTYYTSPALKTLALTGGSTYTVSYPATSGMQGSFNNCFMAPVAWDGTMTITAWRPQRPGDTSIGESTFMDIGHSSIRIDIPNAPCSSATTGGCSGSGPGSCSSSSYTIPSGETNLTVDTNGLADGFSDTAASSANTFSFNFNLNTCLGSIPFPDDNKIVLDLQTVSLFGDNAAVKFCIQKP